MKEKQKIALPYPPRVETRAPMKKTAMPVIILPRLKQTPVAVALSDTGNRAGINMDNAPWLIPKKNVMKAIRK